MTVLSSAERVAERFLIAKGGISLRPEYEKALKALEQGDLEPIRAFGDKVQEIITPGGGLNPADWFGALGTAKRNAIKKLRRDIESNRLYLSRANVSNPQMLAYSIDRVREWGKGLRTLELATEVGDQEREIHHGPFIVVPVPGVTKAAVDAALEALDAAAEKIRPKFPQVLYGKVFLANHLAKNTSAHYVYSSDSLSLNVKASRRFDDIYTICHEFGHRYDHKFLEKSLKNKFWALSTRKQYEFIQFDEKLRDKVADEVVFLAKQRAIGKPLPKMSPELEAWLKSPDGPTNIKRYIGEFLTYTIDEAKLHAAAKGKKDALVTTGKVLQEPLAVTSYGATNPTENFAEAFAHYVLGKALAPEFVEILNEAR